MVQGRDGWLSLSHYDSFIRNSKPVYPGAFHDCIISPSPSQSNSGAAGFSKLMAQDQRPSFAPATRSAGKVTQNTLGISGD